MISQPGSVPTSRPNASAKPALPPTTRNCRSSWAVHVLDPSNSNQKGQASSVCLIDESPIMVIVGCLTDTPTPPGRSQTYQTVWPFPLGLIITRKILVRKRSVVE